MSTKPPREAPRCDIARTLEIVGEKWTMLIVRNSFRGQTTFSEFRDDLGIPTDILATRLATLVAHGIFEKHSYRDAGNRERFSYHLTAAGAALKTVMAAMNQWGEQFNPSQWGPVSRFVDSQTGQNVTVVFVSPEGIPLPSSDVQVVPGPAATVPWQPLVLT
jgi:DNA-binding HxlR family transcriptional regulator